MCQEEAWSCKIFGCWEDDGVKWSVSGGYQHLRRRNNHRGGGIEPQPSHQAEPPHHHHHRRSRSKGDTGISTPTPAGYGEEMQKLQQRGEAAEGRGTAGEEKKRRGFILLLTMAK
jgi:hypothetical protein